MENEDKISIFLSTIFASISLVDFKTILDIILILLSIVNILVIIIIKFVRYYKNDGKIDKEELEDITQDVDKLKNKIKEGEEKWQKKN